MSRQVHRYSTDLTDAEWANLEGRVPAPLESDWSATGRGCLEPLLCLFVSLFLDGP